MLVCLAAAGACLEWSLTKDTAKYTEATRAEDFALLRSLLAPPLYSEAEGGAPDNPGKERSRRVLGSGLRFLDVADMARCCMVCKDFRGE